MKVIGDKAIEFERTPALSAGPAPAQDRIGRSGTAMLTPLAQIGTSRLERVAAKFGDPRVRTAIDVEINDGTGIASVVWAERTRADLSCGALTAFLMDAARLDVPLFCRYQADQERPS